MFLLLSVIDSARSKGQLQNCRKFDRNNTVINNCIIHPLLFKLFCPFFLGYALKESSLILNINVAIFVLLSAPRYDSFSLRFLYVFLQYSRLIEYIFGHLILFKHSKKCIRRTTVNC